MSQRDNSSSFVARAGGLLAVAVLATSCGGSRPIVATDRGAADQTADHITCSSGTLCGGKCVDIQTDLRHCGACNTVCDAARAHGSPPICVGGACLVNDCAGPKICCSGSVIDPQSDNANCGQCGITCDVTNGFLCTAGKCTCVSGLTNCSGKCVSLTDADNCGACGNKCDWGCNNGMCPECPPGLTVCSGNMACVNTTNDSSNCGFCGKTCTGGKVCNNGTCACPTGQTDCSGTCANLQTDPLHCGNCTTVCPTGLPCNAGHCGCVCPTGQLCCGSPPMCVNTATDNNNCGVGYAGCGVKCTGGKNCVVGVCACPSKLPTDCGGQCVNLDTDPANCSGCGKTCGTGQTCVASVCTP